MKVPVGPSHTVTLSTMLHLAGSEECKADHYQWRAVLLRRSTALLPAPQRKWENIANVYSPYECVCVGKVCVYVGGGGGVMLCAPVMPEAWPALLNSSQACLPSQNVLTSGGLVCKCSVDVFAEVLVWFGVWCRVQQLWWVHLLL